MLQIKRRYDTQQSPGKSCGTGTAIANQYSTSSIKPNLNQTPSQVIRMIQRTRDKTSTGDKTSTVIYN